MPRPPPNTIATIVINDGVSAEMKELKRKFSTAATGLGDLSASIAGAVTENLFTSIKLIGLGSLVGGGGFVVSIAAITAELSKFAAKGLILKSTVQELNLTLAEFKQLVNIGMAQGLSKEQAEADVIRFAEAVLDLRRGVDSDTRRQLEEKGTFGSGTIVSRQLQQRLSREGDRPFGIMLDILRQRRAQSAGSNEDRLAAEIWGNAFGIGSPAWNQAIDNLEEFASDSIGPAEDAAKEFLLAQLQLILELENLRAEFATAAIPALEALTGLLAKWLDPENMEAFRARLRVWIKAINETNWAGIRQDIDSFRTEGVGGMRRFMGDISRTLRAAERINAIVRGWHKEQGQWTPGVAVPYLTAPTMAPITDNPPPPSTDAPARFTDSTQAPLPTTTRYTISDEYKRWQLENAESLSGGYSTNIEDRRDESSIQLRSNIEDRRGETREPMEWGGGELAFEGRADLTRFQRDLNEMGREFNDLYDLVDLDKIRALLAPGTTGGNTEGGVATKGRTAPPKTKGGGADAPRRPWPYVPMGPSPQATGRELADIISPHVSPLSRLGLQESRIQTYDELREAMRGDQPETKTRFEDWMKEAYGFAFAKDVTKPYIYFDVNQQSPKTTLAHEGGHVGRQLVQQAGQKDPTLRGYGASLNQWREGPKEETAQRFQDVQEARRLHEAGMIGDEELKTARSRVFSHLLGGADISVADQLEYGRHNKMYEDYAARMLAKPKEEFPPDWKFHPRTGERIPGRQERDQIDNAINGLRPPESNLELNVNVRGQPGIEVAPSISEGTLMSDEGITVSREVLQ